MEVDFRGGVDGAATTAGPDIKRNDASLKSSSPPPRRLALTLSGSTLAAAAVEAARFRKSGCAAAGLAAKGGVAHVGSPICVDASLLIGDCAGLSHLGLDAELKVDAGSGELDAVEGLALAPVFWMWPSATHVSKDTLPGKRFTTLFIALAPAARFWCISFR